MPRQSLTRAIVAAIVVQACAMAGQPSLGAATAQSMTVASCWSGIKVATSIVAGFKTSGGTSNVQFTPCDGDQIVESLKNRHCDVGIVRESLAPNAAKDLGAGFDALPIGRLAVCVAVNAKNPTNAMTLGDLRNVFSARSATWKEIWKAASGPRIEIFGTSRFTTESDILRKTVMRGAPWAKELTRKAADAPHVKKSGDAVMGAVIKDPHAIGFLLLADGKALDKRMHVLGIARDEHSKPVWPTAATVDDGTYLLADRLTLYVRHDARPEVREFCDFALGPAAAKIARNCGYWPQYDMKPLEEKTRLAEVKAHRAAEIPVSGGPAWQGLIKDLGAEFSKAKTAVEMRYHPVGQGAAVSEFVGGGEEPSPPAAQPSPPAPLPSCRVRQAGEGSRCELLLIDSILDDKTVVAYDKAWSAIRPREVPLGWRAAGIVVHPTNPLSVISFCQLRDLYGGKIKDWAELEEAGSGEQGKTPSPPAPLPKGEGSNLPSPPAPLPSYRVRQAGEGSYGKGAIRIYGPPPDDTICLLVESKLGLGRQHVNIVPRGDVRKLVLSVARDPLALGVVDLAQMPAGEASVKLLAIAPPFTGSTAPTCDNLPPGYWLSQPVGLWVSSKASQAAKDFGDFLASGECAATLARHGLVPKVAAVKKLAAAGPLAAKKGR